MWNPKRSGRRPVESRNHEAWGKRGFVNRALFALVAFFVVGSALGQSPEPARIRITTWNLEWFPNGSEVLASFVVVMAGSNPVSVGIESIRYVSSNRSRTAR
jgi:hypothetical protein